MVMDLMFLIEERKLLASEEEIHSFYFYPKDDINSKFPIDSASFKRIKRGIVPINLFDYFSVLANFYFELGKNIKESGDVNVFYENSLLNVNNPSLLRFNNKHMVDVPFKTKEQLYSFVRENGFDIGHLTLGGNPKKVLKDLQEGRIALELVEFKTMH